MLEEIGSSGLFICLILLLLSLIALTLFVLLIHSGLFTAVKEVGTAKPPLGKVAIAYKFLKGPYSEAGQTFTEAHIIAPENKCLGIYYDDPKKVPSHELRYVVGSILGPELSEVDADLIDRFNDNGFKTITLPEVEFAVQTRFPHVTTLSILIGIHKAYPSMAGYIEERKLCAHPFLEFYDGSHIHFFAPLSKQEEFWVSECHTDGRGDETGADNSDVNTTLDTSHSVLGDDSMIEEDARNTEDADTQKAAVAVVAPSMTGEADSSAVNVLEVSLDKEVGMEVDGGKGDAAGNPVAEGGAMEDEKEEKEAGGAVVEDDDLDNSSSSSFEVLKNEAVE